MPAIRSSRRSAKRPGFFELFQEKLQVFLARRVVDSMALIFGVLAVFLLVALGSYSGADPSWNTATGTGDIHNWMGHKGAVTADILLQTLGGAALILPLALAVWGYRLFFRLSLRPFALKLSALLLAAIFLSIGIGQIPSFGWLSHPYMGGAGGTVLLNAVDAGLARFDLGVPLPLVSFTAALLSISALLFALCVPMRAVFRTFRVTFGLTARGFRHAGAGAERFSGWVGRYNAPEFVTPDDDNDVIMPAKVRGKRRIQPRLAAESDSFESHETAELAPLPVAVQAPPVKTARKQTSPKRAQASFQLSEAGEWAFPSLELLEEAKATGGPPPDENALRRNAQLLQNVLNDFKVDGQISHIHPGPVVTLYELEPAPGTKSSRVISLSDDIARSMSAVSVRAAVVPGRNVIGIELPNKTRQIVYMRELLESDVYEDSNARLPLVLGKDIGGQPIMADLAKMPHLLVAGTTGSGKSVAVNTMILSLLYRLSPKQCRFIMIDPKMLELSVYDDIPHLLSPVVTEPGKAVVALKWAVREMEDRYRAMSKLGVRNIEGYNERLAEARRKGETIMRKVATGFDPETGQEIYEDRPLDLTALPYIVVVVDEFADLMLVAGKDVENAIQRLAQMARAAGIHLIMATQRPSVDVITGVIKANFPTRISFAVTSKIDSRTILGEGGAEQLLGMGDMLYMAPGGRITRVHGPFVADEDVESVVNFLKSQGTPNYINDVTEESDFGDSDVMGALFGGGSGGEGADELYDQAVALVAREGKASTSFIQRYLQIGYNRAARIIEEMERQGVVSKANATGKREVLITDHGSY
ncbi:MAG: DNA translocase FtsK 4TM domain-containing protein [Alphaproteobacteria bacterium]|nr:DNA translocase FtsK 4TM domain-containing protein [Alphaproteobacteria bacterium]